MTTEERFNEIYKDIENKNLIAMENIRSQAQVENKQNHIILAVIIVANILLNMLIYDTFHTLNSFFTALLIMLSIVIYAAITVRGGKSQIEKFKMDFKTKIVGALLESFNQNLTIQPQCRYTIYYI